MKIYQTQKSIIAEVNEELFYLQCKDDNFEWVKLPELPKAASTVVKLPPPNQGELFTKGG